MYLQQQCQLPHQDEIHGSCIWYMDWCISGCRYCCSPVHHWYPFHSSKIPFFGIQWKSCHGKQCRMCRTFLKETGFCANPQSAIRIGFCTSNLWVFQRTFSIPKELSFWQVKINSAARVFTAIAHKRQALHRYGSSWFRRGWLWLSEAMSPSFGCETRQYWNILKPGWNPFCLQHAGGWETIWKSWKERFFGNFQNISHDLVRNTHQKDAEIVQIAQSCSGSENMRKYWTGFDSSSGWVTCGFYVVRHEIWIQPSIRQVSDARQVILFLGAPQGPSCWLNFQGRFHDFPCFSQSLFHIMFYGRIHPCCTEGVSQRHGTLNLEVDGTRI